MALVACKISKNIFPWIGSGQTFYIRVEGSESWGKCLGVNSASEKDSGPLAAQFALISL